MSKSRLAKALFALLPSLLLTSAGLAADVCQNPSFRISRGSPLPIRPQGLASQPTGLAAGTYVARPGVQPGCGCDLAVGLMTQDAPRRGFLAVLRGNDDGTFTESPDLVRPLNGLPVAIATARFRTDAPVEGIVAVTSTPAGSGQAEVFVPDANGAYPQTPTAVFPVGPNPAAITVGDFNGDGNRDVAVINKANSSLTILLGIGNGSFAPNAFTVSNLGGVPESVTTGRFSGNSGADDIAIGVEQDVGGSLQVGIVIVPGSSTAEFAPAPFMAIGQRGSFKPSIVAAGLSGPSVGGAGRSPRDLAIAFTDHRPTGDAVGLVKVLLGRDGGGFGDVNGAQTLDLGAVLPRSVDVADLDDDGVVDLIVSTFSDSTSQTDGTIRFFQGHATPPDDVGFQPNPRWFAIPETTGIRPRSLVAGRFGNHRPDAPIASMGIAAINAPDLNSVAVFLGNGQGAFTEPSLVTTPVGNDYRMFVSGDFHSGDGASPLQDLAFITQANGQNVLRVLRANGAGGFALADAAQPPPLAGNSPSFMVAGQFVSNGPTGLALIDDTGGVGQRPLLKIFLGQGNGVLTLGPELPLDDVGRPRAIATGHFRGSNMPLDIAVVGDTTPPGSSSTPSGKVTLLFNKGQGEFTLGTSQPLPFAPGALATSSRLSSEGRSDLLIRDANANRFLFLINIGNGNFRLPIGPNQGIFPGAGTVGSLLVGNVAHSDTDALDDVVTYDDDLTLKIFVNNGHESFDLRTVAHGNDPHFLGAKPPYLLADFGSGILGLAAPVIRGGGQVGLLLLQGDGTGGFTPVTGEVPLQQPRGTAAGTRSTIFFQTSDPISTFMNADIQLREVVVAQFRSALHGNSKRDFALITQASESSQDLGNCPGDTRPLPAPTPLPRPQTCPERVKDTDCPPHGPHPCFFFQGPCCFCRSTDIPVGDRCPNSCDFPIGPNVPFQAACDTNTSFTASVSVFGNTCGD